MTKNMKTYEPLKRVEKALCADNCGLAIQEMNTYLSAWPEQQTADKLSELKADYDRMADYWRQGGQDDQREEVYRHLSQRMYVLFANVNHYHRMKASPYLHSLYVRVRQSGRDWSLATIRRQLEDFVSNVALLELEPEHTREAKSEALYKSHQQQMNQLFEYVLTSRQWTDSVGEQFEEMMVSPTIDAVDQQLIVSAVTVSLMNQFDMAKFRMLTGICQRSHDEAVRQRALVGWVLSLDERWLPIYPEQATLVRQLVQSEALCKELTELQIQLIYCLGADHDSDTIRREIMPDLLKNNGFRFTRTGIEEVDDDPLEDILHPNASEERMEKLEASFKRMHDMQQQGLDVFYGGFSQLKRYPFFYDISNWLVPYYPQHPDILPVIKQKGYFKLTEQLAKPAPFCNSDKYSFVIGFHEALGRLPDNIRQMMERGEASLGELETVSDSEAASPAYLRRIYLMDLYRFFRLFSHREELPDPFTEEPQQVHNSMFFFSDQVFCNTPLDACKRDIVPLFLKHHYEEAATDLLQTFPEEQRDVQYYVWTHNYDEALRLQPDHERALSLRARERFNAGNYGDALDDYDHLTLLVPDKRIYLRNKAVCLVNLARYEEALKLLYQLNYEQADDDYVNRVLAWALTCCGRLEQADRLFQSLIDGERATLEDRLNYGYCLWLQGRIDAAADSFRMYVSQNEGLLNNYDHFFDEKWLEERGIGRLEARMMRAMV